MHNLKHKHQRILITIAISTIILSCNIITNKTDDNIIPRDSMVQIITEIHLADAVLNNAQNNGYIEPDSTPKYYSEILKKHNITKEKFDRSIKHYVDQLEEFDNMYDEVIAKLNLKQIEIESSNQQD